jgi:phosphoglycolate phosphatase-like HAD superfamily hydrolase
MTSGNSHGKRFASVRVLVFDLDGTLIDSKRDLILSVNAARNAGTWMCGVTYGLSSHRLAEYPPDLLVDSLTELLPALP